MNYQEPMPRNREGITHKVEILSDHGIVEGYITGNLNEYGEFKEMFLHGFGKEGSTVDGWTQAVAVLFSMALQGGADFRAMAGKLHQMKFEPYGPTNNPQVPYCNSVPDYIAQWLWLRFGEGEL